MITASVLRNSIEELHNITRVDFTVYDYTGSVVYSSQDDFSMNRAVIDSFIDSPADSQVIGTDHLLKIYDDGDLCYVLVASGSSDDVYTMGRIAASQLRLLLSAYREKIDKNNYFQNLLMDNMLMVDAYNKAKKLHIEVAAPRVVFVVQSESEKDGIVFELLKGMFEGHSKDMVTEVDETNIILIKSVDLDNDINDFNQIAQSIVDTINAEAMVNVRVGYGTVANELKDVSKSYKEAMMSVDVGKIFYAEKKVTSYGSLGIGRLIYQLPDNLCQMFIEEIFKNADPSSFDEEIVSTVYKFFENNLNVSETSRQLFIHRNTLVYRIEKLKAVTGLDVRVFDDALTFMIAMMVYNYHKYQKNQ